MSHKVFDTLRNNADKNLKDRNKISRLMNVFRKYQMHHGFAKYKKQANWEADLMDRGRIDGAYLLLKRFKGRLKQFDKALERIYDEKASKQEFERLTLSLDKNRTEVIF